MIVPGPGQLDPLPAEHPTPPPEQINDPAVGIKVINPAGTIGEGGEEVTLVVGEGDAGHDIETIAAVGQQHLGLFRSDEGAPPVGRVPKYLARASGVGGATPT